MTPDPFHLELRDFACNLAQEGVTIARQWASRISVRRKADRSPVTEADHAVQEALIEKIAAQYPDHAIVAEEELKNERVLPKVNDTQFCWVIDPIDGTRNYVRGLPIYATSAAVMHRGTPVAGAICDASTDALYTAALHDGAMRNAKRLEIEPTSNDGDPTVLISSFHAAPIPPVIRKWMNDYHFRNYGSLALHLAWVAAGFADAAYSVEGHVWDIAAGALVVMEARGIVTSNDGTPVWPIDLGVCGRTKTPILAGSPPIQAKLLQSLTGDAPDRQTTTAK